MKKTSYLSILFGVIILSQLVFVNPVVAKNCTNYIYATKVDTVISNLWIRVDSFKLDILPPSSGVSFYRDGVIYLSSTRLEGGIPGNHISFGISDARYSILKDASIEGTEVFSSDIPFVLPCEAVSFSSDYNTMYYTKYLKSEDSERIFKAKLTSEEDGGWTFDDEPLVFCTDESKYSHPALSSDGNVLVFASDCKGSIGGMDLFVTEFIEGEWSNPKNLGDAVNSRANELYPYLDALNNLYFSSDNPKGYGGYDIYVCRFIGKTWGKPINLGSQINTEFDDVAFSINRSNGKTAFYTVKENQGRRSQQLFLVNLNNNIPDTLLTLSQHFTSPDLSSTIILSLEPAIEATSRRAEESRLRSEETHSKEDIIKYRVQFLTSFNSGTRPSINIDSRNYDVYEYLYSGAYRLFVGEFDKLSEAVNLQNLLKNNDYPRASVVAFKNNVLSLDPGLMTERKIERPVIKADVIEEIKAEPETKVQEQTPAKTEAKNKEPETKNIEQPVKAEAMTKDQVVYRVQILSSTKSKGNIKINIAGKQYDSWEYFYVGAYRTTVGEFKTLKEAGAFQKIVRQNGYPQAFAATFINGKRKVK